MDDKPYLLISSCLYGCKCRYDGKDNLVSSLDKLKEKYHLVLACPEVDGGLSIPRPPSEIKGDKVINIENIDVTENYQKGAYIALNLCKKFNIKVALLKEKSPSCGKYHIYDGTFTRTLINGEGITTRLLKAHGIKVYNETEIDKLL